MSTIYACFDHRLYYFTCLIKARKIIQPVVLISESYEASLYVTPYVHFSDERVQIKIFAVANKNETTKTLKLASKVTMQ